MKEKKESSIMNIFVYLLIVILIILIILPPLTRVFFKESNTDTNINSSNGTNAVSSATALTCRREVTVGTMIYNVTITSNYGNNTLNKVTFTYEAPEVVDNTVIDNPVLTEMNAIRNSGLVEETTNGLSTIFTLTRDVKEANPTNTSLDTFFQPLDSQTSTLESLGYTCSSLTA